MKMTIALAILAAALVPSWAAEPVPRIEWGTAPPEYAVPDRQVTFGYLIAREDRTDKRNDRLVRLPFLVLTARSSGPASASGPVLFMAGEPGASSLDAFRSVIGSPLDERDVILMEQRGGPRAQPTLDCPEVDSLMAESLAQGIAQIPDQVLLTHAIESCVKRFKDQGIRLARYSARDSAADAEDLRRLLKISQWNLYSSSYASRLALTVIRDYPQSVRSAILDSPIPFEASPDEDAPEMALAALRRLFAQCRNDSTCASCYPGLEDRFFRLLRRAGRSPIAVRMKNPARTVTLDSGGVFEVCYRAMLDPTLLVRLPGVLDRASKGEDQALEPLVAPALDQPKVATGARYAFWSNDETPFERLSAVLEHPNLPREIRSYRRSIVPAEAFAVWPQGSATSGANVQVRSSTPVLVVSGQLDPLSDPGWRRNITRQMSRGRQFELRGYSHSAFLTHPCGPALVKQFLDSPTRRLSSDCIEKTPAPQFECAR